jgi:AcrR family transcriptional regulator
MRRAREAIVNAAMEVFARNGYAGASIRQICQAAGVTKPVLYYHFRSKEHLFRELMIDSFGYYLKAMLRASNTQGDLRQRLVGIIYNDFQAAKVDPLRIRFLLRMIFAPEEQRPNFDYIEELEKQRRLIAGVLEEGIAGRNGHAEAKELATALMGMDMIAVLEHALTGRATLTRKRAEKCVDILLRGCLNPGAKSIPDGNKF